MCTFLYELQKVYVYAHLCMHVYTGAGMYVLANHFALFYLHVHVHVDTPSKTCYCVAYGMIMRSQQ